MLSVKVLQAQNRAVSTTTEECFGAYLELETIDKCGFYKKDKEILFFSKKACFDAATMFYTMGKEVPMGYQVKWMETHLGVTRSALRVYEVEGLIPKNKDRKYREYNDDDVEHIWNIKVLQGIGYTLKEIKSILVTQEMDVQDSLENKIQEMKRERERIDRYLAYANTIRLTGMIPSVKNIGSIRYDDFQKEIDKSWVFPEAEQYVDVLEKYENMSAEEFSRSDVGFLLTVMEKCNEAGVDFVTMFAPKYFITEIMKRKHLSPDNPETQLLIKMYYEQYMSLINTKEDRKESFARYSAVSHMEGVLGRRHQQEYGKEACRYYADALAIFAGYKNHKELMEEN